MTASTPIRTASKPWRAALLTAALTVALAGCSSGKWGFPYRAGVQQGNWITQEQIALLQPGMSREQVRFALGSPTLTSVLHADRWDYPYYYKPGYGNPEERKFTVWFENDQLVRWSGDEQPTLEPFQIQKQANAEAPSNTDQTPQDGDSQSTDPSNATRRDLELNAPQALPPADNPSAPAGTAEPLR